MDEAGPKRSKEECYFEGETMRSRLFILFLPVLLHGQFIPATGWCGNVHCNPQLDDATGQASPTGLNVMCKDTIAQGSKSGGGVTTNGSVVAVTYAFNNGYIGPATVVYDATVSDGGTCHQIWSSNVLDGTAWTVAPLIGSHTAPIPDEVIAADEKQIIAFDGAGGVIWDTCWYGGTAPSSCYCPAAGCNADVVPLEPVIIADGGVTALIIGTHGVPGGAAPIFEVNSETGAIMNGAGTFLGKSGNDAFSPDNIVCAGATAGTFYIATNWTATPAIGRMYGIRVSNGVFSVATGTWPTHVTGTMPWLHDFNGPTGGSPLCVNSGPSAGVFTDGKDFGNIAHTDVFGFNQGTGAVLYNCSEKVCPGCMASTGCHDIQGTIGANSAKDPRGGHWIPCKNCANITRRCPATGGRSNSVCPTSGLPGSTVQTINLSHIIPGETHDTFVWSIVNTGTMANGDGTLTLGLTSNGGGKYIVVIDAVSGVLQSYYTLAGTGTAEGQFPTFLSPLGTPWTGFTTTTDGLVMLGLMP
jgi:hypothetical protein